jgi:hypothetical protein
MELMTRALRPSTMMSPRQVRGTVLAVLLCSALAGCGSVTASVPAGAGATSSAPGTSAAQAASSAPASSGASSSSSATPAAAASATGCAGVDQATSVTVHRVLHLVEPTRAGTLSKTQHNATLVRALFRQLCAAVSHPATAKGATLHCPANFGIAYLGTFYDGSRTLAKFNYGATGCQLVSLTVDGKTRTTMVVGAASAAAPKLRADLAAVLGVPRLAIAQPVTGTGKSGATR